MLADGGALGGTAFLGPGSRPRSASPPSPIPTELSPPIRSAETLGPRLGAAPVLAVLVPILGQRV